MKASGFAIRKELLSLVLTMQIGDFLVRVYSLHLALLYFKDVLHRQGLLHGILVNHGLLVTLLIFRT